jgi:hypothetical protein
LLNVTFNLVGIVLAGAEVWPVFIECGLDISFHTEFGANSTWMLLAAIWYAATEFSMEADIQTALNEYWPYFCTCKYDANQIEGYIEQGLVPEGEECKKCDEIFSTCSSAASQTA